jgi:hypothetical protein
MITETEREMLSCRVGMLVHEATWYRRTDSGILDLINPPYVPPDHWTKQADDFFPTEDDFVKHRATDPYGYATDLESAMELLLEIETQCHWITSSDPRGGYDMILVNKEKGLDNTTGQHGETIPEAICLTVLDGFKRGMLSKLDKE